MTMPGEVARLLVDLTERYTAEVVPPCRVCGRELRLGKLGGGGPTEWSCPVTDEAPIPRNAEEWDHYRRSGFTQYRHTDSAVLALIALVPAVYLSKSRTMSRLNEALQPLEQEAREHYKMLVAIGRA